MLKLVFRDRWRLQIIGPLTCHVRLGQAQISGLSGKGIYLPKFNAYKLHLLRKG
jgi:hypothetical protein